jgi:hypothetical protein
VYVAVPEPPLLFKNSVDAIAVPPVTVVVSAVHVAPAKCSETTTGAVHPFGNMMMLFVAVVAAPN